VRADSFAVFLAKRLKRHQQLDLLCENVPDLNPVFGKVGDIEVRVFLILSLIVMGVPCASLETAHDFSSGATLFVLVEVSNARCRGVSAEKALKGGTTRKRKGGGASTTQQANLGSDPSIHNHDFVHFSKSQTPIECSGLGPPRFGGFVCSGNCFLCPEVRRPELDLGSLFSNFVEIDSHKVLLRGGP
jgi:hypothetical protein